MSTVKAIDKFRNRLSKLREREIDHVLEPTSCIETYLNEIEHELEEGYVELPRDANGDVWRVGDFVVGEVNPNNPKRVERMLWYGPDSGWQLETDSIIYPCPERPRHHHAPTVEDVLREFVFDACGDSTPEDAVVKRFAERLQLRGEDE